MSKPSLKEQGFSLLEVIVALAIMGLCVTVLLRIFASVSAAARLSDDYYQALQIAETQLALLSADDNPVGFKRGTIDDFYRWETSVEVYKPDLNNPLFANSDLIDPEDTHVPYLYEVSVTWGDRRPRHIELSTIRLGVMQ